MASTVRFKFRSAATFDSVEIDDNQSSISIRDLKSKIVVKKHLNLCQDFDLVFSDSISGIEYTDENTRVPSGSSVIIKRVPAKSPPLLRASDTSTGCLGARDANCVGVFDQPTMDIGVNDFDDFGVDLCPPPHISLSDTAEKLQFNNNGKKDKVVSRCSQELLASCQKIESAHHAQSKPKDSSANEESTLVMPKPKIEGQPLPERFPAKHSAMENSSMPSELKCSLCRTFFKEAVMIPCCQHSFCGNCIRAALSDNAKCPMCSSTKCKPEGLLPNVSLRQAIVRFLESQPLLNGSENDLQRYAPDGESGIQVMDVSSATTIPPRLQLRSNKVMQSKLHDRAHLADKCTPDTLEDFSEFEGENDPQTMVHRTKEAVSCSKKEEEPSAFTRGGERNFAAPGRPNKGPRTCYMCGSPDHLIRDCPGAAHCSTSQWNGVASLPGTVSGYPPSYWPGSSPHSRPYINMYGSPGMMFYNAATATISPFAYPSYAPSMYGGYPVSNYGNVGGLTLPVGNIAMQPRHVEHLELQGCTKQQRNKEFDSERDWNHNREHNVNTQHDFVDRGPHHSGDGFARRAEGNHKSRDNPDGDDTNLICDRQGNAAGHLGCGRDLRIPQSDKSSSETDLLKDRVRVREDKHKKVHRTYRRNDEIEKNYGRDSSQKYYQPKKESGKRKRMEHDERKSDRHSYSRSRSSLERSYSGGDARKRRDDSTHKSRHSKYNGKEMHHDRGR